MRYVVKWGLQFGKLPFSWSVNRCTWDCSKEHTGLPVQVKAQTTEVYEQTFDLPPTSIPNRLPPLPLDWEMAVLGRLYRRAAEPTDFEIGVLQRLDRIIEEL